MNLGAQKNFAKYAERIAREWEKNKERFNEAYFRRIVARGVVFRSAERLTSEQTWYGGSFRPNIVAYTIALIGELCSSKGVELDYDRIWAEQRLPAAVAAAIANVGKIVHNVISETPPELSNVIEWCKKEACWSRLQARLSDAEAATPPEFWDCTLNEQQVNERQWQAKVTQKTDDGIAAQRAVLSVAPREWERLMNEAAPAGHLSPKDTL